MTVKIDSDQHLNYSWFYIWISSRTYHHLDQCFKQICLKTENIFVAVFFIWENFVRRVNLLIILTKFSHIKNTMQRKYFQFSIVLKFYFHKNHLQMNAAISKVHFHWTNANVYSDQNCWVWCMELLLKYIICIH